MSIKGPKSPYPKPTKPSNMLVEAILKALKQILKITKKN